MRFPASCGGAAVSEQEPLKAIAGQVAQFLMEAKVVGRATAKPAGGGSAGGPAGKTRSRV